MLEVAAVGIHDERSGEAVKVYVVRKDPALTEAELLAHCRQHLTGCKVPKAIEFRTEPLQKTNIGKILRRERRTSAAAWRQSARAGAGDDRPTVLRPSCGYSDRTITSSPSSSSPM